MADTLDLCLRYLDAAMLEAVVPLLSQKVSAAVPALTPTAALANGYGKYRESFPKPSGGASTPPSPEF